MNPNRKRELRRELPLSALTQLRRLVAPVLPARSVLSEYSDRRLYDPTRSVRAPFSFRRSDVRLVDKRPLWSATQLSFAVPKRVAICIRRKDRREVLFAKGVGGGRVRKPRRNAWSSIKC